MLGLVTLVHPDSTNLVGLHMDDSPNNHPPSVLLLYKQALEILLGFLELILAV